VSSGREQTSPRTASILIVGNEILCGRTLDTNSHWLCSRLYGLGIRVRRKMTVADDVREIVEAVKLLRNGVDYVIVAGGIGPTPDDVTREAIARALGKRLVAHPEAERIIREHYRDRINAYRLQMARLPEGARLIRNPRFAAPGFWLENVFVFPGVPQLLREMFDSIIGHLQTARFYEQSFTTHLAESEFSSILYSEAAGPGVSIGSYPRMDDSGGWTVTIVVSGTDEGLVQRVASKLRERVSELERARDGRH